VRGHLRLQALRKLLRSPKLAYDSIPIVPVFSPLVASEHLLEVDFARRTPLLEGF
jgi:hypothetical protein